MVLRYGAWRLLQVVPVLFIISTLTFVTFRMIPGDPAALLAGEDATPDTRAPRTGPPPPGAHHLVVFPGLAILATVRGLNLVGDHLADGRRWGRPSGRIATPIPTLRRIGGDSTPALGGEDLTARGDRLGQGAFSG